LNSFISNNGEKMKEQIEKLTRAKLLVDEVYGSLYRLNDCAELCSDLARIIQSIDTTVYQLQDIQEQQER
jgi:hypothetical protein